MSDSQLRTMIRTAMASGNPLDIEAAINFGRRSGMDCWALLENGIPLEMLAEEVAALTPPLDATSVRARDLAIIGLALNSGSPEYLSGRSGKYPTLEMCADPNEYWRLSNSYDLLPDGTLLLAPDFTGRFRYEIVTDPQLLAAFVTFSQQTDVIAKARRILVADAAGGNPILKEILAWNMAYNNGVIEKSRILDVDGEEVEFWPVGRNASCSFMAGFRYGQRYQYAWCEGDETPTVRPVEDWRGYYGHY